MKNNSMDISNDKQAKSQCKTWTWLRKRNLKKETESVLIAAQNNAIRTIYFRAKKDKTLQESRYSLCGGRDEMINQIISKCC